YYGVCKREVMEKRFPDSKRTYTRLKDVEVCGSGISVSHVSMATEHLDMWESLIGTRKSPLRQASMIGLDTFFQVFTRSITLEELAIKISKRIGIQGRAVIWPHAEPCMDVDKPHQLELLRADLAQTQRKSIAKAKAAAKKTTTAKSALTPKKKPGTVKKIADVKKAGTKLKPKAKPKLQR